MSNSSLEVLKKAFHSVADEVVVFRQQDGIQDVLREYDVKYTVRGPLIVMGLDEVSKVPGLGDFIKNFIKVSQSGRENYRAGSLFNNLLNKKQDMGMVSRGLRIFNKNFIKIDVTVESEEAKKIVDEIRRQPKKKIRTFYIDERVLELFERALVKIGAKKKANEVVQKLLLSFADKILNEKQEDGKE